MAKDAKDPLSRYFEAAMGLTELTRQRAEKLVRNVMTQGEAAGNPRELVENLLERSTENREALVTLVRGETKRAMKAMGLATQNDVERLEQQLRAVRRQLAEADEERAAARTAGETSGEPGKAATQTVKEPANKKATKTAKKAAKKASGGSSGGTSAGKKTAKKTARKKKT